jgi:ubiquinone/menaquinone biosynthesis C-methylase UbiE
MMIEPDLREIAERSGAHMTASPSGSDRSGRVGRGRTPMRFSAIADEPFAAGRREVVQAVGPQASVPDLVSNRPDGGERAFEAERPTQEQAMPEELAFKDDAAAEYDRAFAHVTAYFMPFLMRAAHLAPGMRVLDIAAGTGLSAAAALAAVGPSGHVTAADISPAMVAKARERLGGAANVSVSVEDGQALSFPDGSFDAVLCNLGLMFFPNPVKGLSEFCRVLRPGGRAVVSVNTVVGRSYNHQINVMIARYVPGLAAAVTRTFALAEASRLQSLYKEAGFADFETDTVAHTFVLPSFEAYYGPFERGGASTGQALAGLPAEIRRAVREEVRRDMADTGGPVRAEAEYRIASGRR